MLSLSRGSPSSVVQFVLHLFRLSYHSYLTVPTSVWRYHYILAQPNSYEVAFSYFPINVEHMTWPGRLVLVLVSFLFEDVTWDWANIRTGVSLDVGCACFVEVMGGSQSHGPRLGLLIRSCPMFFMVFTFLLLEVVGSPVFAVEHWPHRYGVSGDRVGRPLFGSEFHSMTSVLCSPSRCSPCYSRGRPSVGPAGVRGGADATFFVTEPPSALREGSNALLIDGRSGRSHRRSVDINSLTKFCWACGHRSGDLGPCIRFFVKLVQVVVCGTPTHPPTHLHTDADSVDRDV
jgi:hypothetical protein